MLIAAYEVYTGKLTPGDFVLLQALFMQMAGPLFNMGTLFRQLDETSVDVEELFHMLRTKPIVQEKEDAKEFEFKKGEIKFDKISFKHYVMDDSKEKKEKSVDKGEVDFNF